MLVVQPQQLHPLLRQIQPALDGGRHRVISVVSGTSISPIRDALGSTVPVARVMPNTSVSIGESMTCLCSDDRDGAALAEAVDFFEAVPGTLVIEEDPRRVLLRSRSSRIRTPRAISIGSRRRPAARSQT